MIVGGDLLLNCWALNKYLDVSGFQPSPQPLRSARSILEGTTFSKAMKKNVALATKFRQNNIKLCSCLGEQQQKQTVRVLLFLFYSILIYIP